MPDIIVDTETLIKLRFSGVRPAVETDVSSIVDMGVNFHGSTRYRSLIGQSVPTMAELAYRLVTGADSVVLLLTDRSDVSVLDAPAVGMLGLVLFIHPISGEKFVAELFWWVEPAYRGRGIRLLKAGERWARSRGARAIQMIAPTSDVAAIYERLGYEFVESTYHKMFDKQATEDA